MTAENCRHFTRTHSYIHRFTSLRSDTGLSYPARAKTIYVQLDKCFDQFKGEINAEAEDGKPDRLQKWLAAIADVNDARVAQTAAEDETLSGILSEIHNMSQDKEVQIMLTQEMFDRMDRESYGDEREEKGERKFANLTGKLLSAGRIEDVKKASADPMYRKKLYEEFQIQ